MPSTVGILGGGVSGCVVLDQLVKRVVNEKLIDVEIHVWEKDAELGPGLAWGGKNSDCQIFNLLAGAASVIPGEWDSFMKFCQAQNIDDVTFYSYPPRSKFAAYMKDVVSKTLTLASENNITVHVHTSSEVIRVNKCEDASKLKVSYTESGEPGRDVEVGCLFLCSGPPSYISNNYPHLVGADGYVSTPWPYSVLGEIPAAADVAVLGTGLTAVDVVKQLNAQGHTGKVHMVSRRGLLPTIKAVAANPFLPLTHATIAGVQSAMEAAGGAGSVGLVAVYVDLIKQEVALFKDKLREELTAAAAGGVGVAAVGGEDTAAAVVSHSHEDDRCFTRAVKDGTDRDGVKELREGMELSAKGVRIAYQDCIIALSIQGVLRFMWSTLSLEEQAVFAERYGTVFQVYTNSMPPESGAAILSYVDGGQCTVRGGLKSVDVLDKHTFRVSLQAPSSDIGVGPVESSVDVQWVVNATGFETHYTSLATPSPLFEGMMQDGLLLPHPMGGLRADYASGRVEVASGHDGEKMPQLYAVGYPLRGVKLVVSGLSYCVQDACCAVGAMQI